MSVVSVAEVWTGRRGGKTTFHTQTVYTRSFIVKTDDPNDGPEIIFDQAVEIPEIRDTYTPPSEIRDEDIICVSVVPEQSPMDPTFWMVRCEYTSDTVNYAIQDPAEMSWETEYLPYAYSMCFSGDYSDNAFFEDNKDVFDDPNPGFFPPTQPDVVVVNSAGDPFDPPPQGQRPIPKLIITRNEADNPLMNKQSFEMTLNKDPYGGYEAGQAFLKSITAQKVNVTYDDDATTFHYWRVRYEILFDYMGWSQKLVDAGYRFNDAGTLKQILDPFSSQPYAKPTPLDGSGGVLAHGAAYWWAKANVFRTLSWDELDLPDPTE